MTQMQNRKSIGKKRRNKNMVDVEVILKTGGSIEVNYCEVNVDAVVTQIITADKDIMYVIPNENIVYSRMERTKEEQ